jgi:hypothetical protein
VFIKTNDLTHLCLNVMVKLLNMLVDICDMVDWFMVFNATFNNISVISWWSVLLVEGTGVPGKNHHPVASH